MNDHAPKFSQQVYYVNVQETTPLGDVIIAVSASDEDKGHVTNDQLVSLNVDKRSNKKWQRCLLRLLIREICWSEENLLFNVMSQNYKWMLIVVVLDQSLTYRIERGNIGGAFEINPSSGIIQLARPLDFDFGQQRLVILLLIFFNIPVLILSSKVRVI